MVALTAIYLWGRNSRFAGEFQRWLDGLAGSGLPDLSHARFSQLGSDLAGTAGLWLLIVVRWAVAAALIGFRRWRHLAVFIGSVALVTAGVTWFPTAGTEPGIPKHPSYAAASLAVTAMGIVFGLIPAGRRRWAFAATAVSCAFLGIMAILIGAHTLSEVVVGFAIGFSIPFLGFRLLAPESVFPVTYRTGRTAHLDVGGTRGEAVRVAIHEQLGLAVTGLEPFGLAGSGGSTPLRIELADGRHLFAKLYARNHLRADRWYKLGRTLMYGALEDERSFNSVRRMVEYEDHMLRYLRDHDVRTAAPYGFVEITPEREYLLVTGFIDGAHEILEASPDDRVIGSAIDLVRSLWDAGVAHRDIKPANLLVRDGEVWLIDVFFCQVRPSAWRQSVDLANMLMLLALGSDVDRVYDAALRRFTPDEIAEAFAATHGVTVPSQLRSLVKADPRPLAKAFSERAPHRTRIPVQRWTPRRVLLMGGVLATTAIALLTAAASLEEAGFSP